MALICLLAEGHLLIEDVPGRRQDEPRQVAGRVDRLHVEARPVHARPAARRPRRRQHLRALDGALPLPARPAVRQHRARRRDQPGVAEDAVGAARGDGGAPDHRRRRDPRRWPPPFMVIATQNPVDQEGTYRLPESQLDRFLLRIALGYPGRAAEMSILDGRGAVDSLPKLSPVVSAGRGHGDDRGRARRCSSPTRSRPTSSTSPRPAAATRRSSSACRRGRRCSWPSAARAHAAARGRRYATPDDVKAMAVPGAQPPAPAAHRSRRPPRSGRRHRRDPRRRARADRPLTVVAVRARPTRQGIIVLVAGVAGDRHRADVRRPRAVRDRRRAARSPPLVARRDRRRAPAADRGRALDPPVGADGRRRRARRGARRAGRAHPRRRRSSSSSRSAPTRTARMAVAPLEADTDVSAGYRIPTERRGVLTIGPLVAVRQDVLGLARSTTEVAGVEEVLVSPRAYLARHAAARPGRPRAPPAGARPAARARRLPQPARLRRRRRAAHDPLAGVGALGDAEGAPAQRRGAAALRRAARPARAGRARTARTRSSGRSPPRPASCTAPTGPG